MDANTPFVPHDPFNFNEVDFTAFTSKTTAMTSEIPASPPIPNAEINQRSKMGEKRFKDAEEKLAVFREFNSFLSPELGLPLMDRMYTCVKQAYTTEAMTTKLSDKMWDHGEVAGIELMKSLSINEGLARVHAKMGNPDAIRVVNRLDDLKAKRMNSGGNSKPPTDNPTDKKP